MKNVLITGLHSYIGNSFEAYLSELQGESALKTLGDDSRFDPTIEAGPSDPTDTICVTKCSLREDGWEKTDWSKYDAVLHVAGKAHADVNGASEQMQQEYYRINRDLTLQAAQKAKADGASQFIYLSSAIVYGDSAPIGKAKAITKDTQPQPSNFYGDSKYQAEQAILPLQTDVFHVTVIRPPMVYGKGSKGNFPKLASLAHKTPIFPKIDNARSMIYIKNLCACIQGLILTGQAGIFCPQNPEVVNTAHLVQLLGEAEGRHIRLVPGFSPLMKAASHLTGYVNKVFGNLTYDPQLSQISGVDYQRYTLEESIRDMRG